jgi:sulfur-carrier protein adenylyltransferase/sulfurtransferase
MRLFSFSSVALKADFYRQMLADPAAGGYASFEGWVRNHNEGHAVTRLEYEAFEALAVKEGETIVAEALEKFGVINAACVHRVGSLAIGDMAVWVGVSSRHRAEAFAACRYIIDEVKHRVPIWKKEHYVTGDSGWVNCERCAEAAEHEAWGSGENQDPESAHRHHTHDHRTNAQASHLAHAPSPTPQVLPDYSRQIALRDVGPAGQEKLRASRVLIIGAGGLGVPVLNYLAGAGVGTMGIAEADTLDASNLHRQPMYGIQDVGKPKAQLAAERLRALNPEVKIVTHDKATAQNAVALVQQYDLIVECSDNFATKFLINDAAVKTKRPAIFASVYQYEGQLQVYRPELDGACLRCLWPEATRDGVVGNCAEAGVLGPVPGVLGTLQALEALKLILGLPGQLHDELVLMDLLTLEQRKLKIARRADCRHDSVEIRSRPADIEIAISDLDSAILADYTLIDVRDPHEIEDQPLTGRTSQHLPLASLLDSPPNLDPGLKYLLICARGTRSLAGAEHLRELGFRQVYSLRGGVASLQIERAAKTAKKI